MDAAFVPEGVDADNRLGQRRALADNVVHGLARAGDLRRVDAAGRVAENVRACAHRHHDFLHRGVARAFAQPVDGAFNLPCTAQNAREGVRDRHAEVVVAVDGKFHLVAVLHARHHVFNQLAHFVRRGIADGVRQVDDGRAVLDGGVDDLNQEIGIRAGRVLAGELDVAGILLGVLDHFCRARQHLFGRHFELILHVERRRGEENVDARVGSILDGFPCAVNVLLRRAGERGDGAVAHRLRDGLDALKVAGGGNCEAGFDNIHLQALQTLRHLDFFLQVHRAAGRLFAVAQCRIKNLNLIHARKTILSNSAGTVIMGKFDVIRLL